MSENLPRQGEAGISSTCDDKESSVLECPTCGRDDFDSNLGMRMHHSYAHDESLSYSMYECENCGTEFERQDTKVVTENVYCKPECAKVQVGKDRFYELYWGRGLTIDECADELDIAVNTVGQRLRQYGIPRRVGSGSVEAYLFRIRGREWREHEYVEKGKSTYQIAEENGLTYEWVRRQLHKDGINLRNNWYTGRLSEDELARIDYDYGSDWMEIRENVVERDNHTCQGCGETADRLEVHHIRELRRFSDPDEANELENLVTLCNTCHNRWEHIPVRPTLAD